MTPKCRRVMAVLFFLPAIAACTRTGSTRSGPAHVLRIAYAGDPATQALLEKRATIIALTTVVAGREAGPY